MSIMGNYLHQCLLKWTTYTVVTRAVIIIIIIIVNIDIILFVVVTLGQMCYATLFLPLTTTTTTIIFVDLLRDIFITIVVTTL